MARRILTLVVLLLFLSSSLLPKVGALSDCQKLTFEESIGYYNCDVCGSSSSTDSSTTDPTSASGASNGVPFVDSQSSDTGYQTTIDDDGVDPSPTGSSNHQSSTSYADGKLSALQTNYIALNPGWATAHGLVLGDVAMLKYKTSTIYAVYGDNHVGDTVHAEISVKAAMGLSGVTDPAKVDNLSGVTTTVYPDTHQKLNSAVDQLLIDQIGAQVSGGGSPSSGSQTSCCPASGSPVTSSPAGNGATEMYDATTPSSVPATAQVIASYVDAFYVNGKDAYTQMKEKFPSATVISINEHPGSSSRADIWGIEQGSGKTVSSTIDAIASGKVHGVYGSDTDLHAVQAGLTAKGVARSSYVLWLWGAGTLGQPAIPSGYDAHQYKITNGYDVSTISSSFVSTALGSSAGSSQANAGSLLSLTGDNKISGTFNIAFSSTTPKSTIESVFKKYKPGGIVILGPTKDAASSGFDKSFFDQLAKDAGHKIVTASDEEGGIHRYAYSFNFPNAINMGKMSDSQVKDIGAQVGKTLASDGINTDLAPVLDVAQDSSGTDATTPGRAFSDKADIVTSKAGAFAEGLQSSGVNPTYKHFPGLGSKPNANTDTSSVTTDSLAALKAKDLKPYEVLANKNKAAVMMDNAHIPGLTTGNDVAGTSPAAVNLLRNDYKFTGLIMSDDLGGVGVGESVSRAVADALKAGVNMPLFTYTDDSGIDAAINAAKSAGVDTSQSLQHIDDFLGGSASVSTNSSTINTCCPSADGSGTTMATGNSPAEVVWNFFIGKGLNNTTAAAIMGNLQAESDFSPIALNPSTHGTDPTVSKAWGLGQWTGGKFVTQKAKSGVQGSDTDLLVQLNVMWWEITNSSPTSTQDMLSNFKQITNVDLATPYWQRYYEGSSGQHDQTRVNNAHAWLNYGNGGGSLPTKGDFAGFSPSGASSGSSAGSTSLSGSCNSGAAADTGGFTNPFPDGWAPGRLDMGYDGHFTKQIVSPCDGKMLYSYPDSLHDDNGGWKGAYFVVQCSAAISGLPDNAFYFSEGVSPTVSQGQPVKAGQQIGVPGWTGYSEGPGGIEWGLANHQVPRQTYAKLLGDSCAVGSQSNVFVLSFAKWVETNLHVASPSSTGNAGCA